MVIRLHQDIRLLVCYYTVTVVYLDDVEFRGFCGNVRWSYLSRSRYMYQSVKCVLYFLYFTVLQFCPVFLLYITIHAEIREQVSE